MQLQSQLDEKFVTLEVDNKARKWLVEKGYDSHWVKTNGSCYSRAHQKTFPELLLFGEMSKAGGTIEVTVKKGGLVLKDIPK